MSAAFPQPFPIPPFPTPSHSPARRLLCWNSKVSEDSPRRDCEYRDVGLAKGRGDLVQDTSQGCGVSITGVGVLCPVATAPRPSAQPRRLAASRPRRYTPHLPRAACRVPRHRSVATHSAPMARGLGAQRTAHRALSPLGVIPPRAASPSPPPSPRVLGLAPDQTSAQRAHTAASPRPGIA